MRKRFKQNKSQQQNRQRANRQRRRTALQYKRLNQRRRLSQWLMMSSALPATIFTNESGQ